ncbi:hypothetical protein ACVIJW_009292 [Bradyrhizobium barranii subsp. barranii]
MVTLAKKVLYVGAFAFIIGSFKNIADIVFASFSSIGLKASGGALTAADLARPGFVAAAGFTAAHPLLEETGQFSGFDVLTNLPTILILLFCWILIVLAFFVLSVQLFVTLIEFKLTTLASFILVPFALWGKTAFLAEKTLGNVVASGVKVMVLAIIIGIGSTIFGQLSDSLTRPIDIASAMSLLLAALSLFGLGIFGPRHRRRLGVRRPSAWRGRGGWNGRGRCGGRDRRWRGCDGRSARRCERRRRLGRRSPLCSFAITGGHSQRYLGSDLGRRSNPGRRKWWRDWRRSLFRERPFASDAKSRASERGGPGCGSYLERG